MPKPKSKVPKYRVAMALVAIFTFPSLANALTINAQSTTYCGATNCSTCVNLADYGLNSQRINRIKGMDLMPFLSKIGVNMTDLNYNWTGSTICINGQIQEHSSQYWTTTLDADITIDPWWNSTMPYCNNLNYTTTSTANYTNRIVRFNITNMTNFTNSCGSDVYFVNDTVNGSANAIELPHVRISCSASNWFSGFVKLDYILNTSVRQISYCYGNTTADRSDGNKVFNWANNTNGLYDNFSTAGVPNTTMFTNLSSVPIVNGLAWVNGTGATWRELYSRYSYNTSFCLMTNLTVTATTGTTNTAFGLITATGSAPLNAFQVGYPTANYWNYRNYISGENSATTANNIGSFQVFELCRNNTVATANNTYRINYTSWANYSGAQILNDARQFGYQSLTASWGMGVDFMIVWYNPNPEPIPTYGSQQSNIEPVVTYNAIVDGTVVCFTINDVCVRMSDKSLYFKNGDIII